MHRGRKKILRYADTGYTLRQYFSHTTPEKGPGPGWDMRLAKLLDAEWTMRHFGRTFTTEEALHPHLLPDILFGRWEEIDEEG